MALSDVAFKSASTLLGLATVVSGMKARTTLNATLCHAFSGLGSLCTPHKDLNVSVLVSEIYFYGKAVTWNALNLTGRL